MKSKPHPWMCRNCRKKTVWPVRETYSTEMKHDGRVYSVCIKDAELHRCRECGWTVIDDQLVRAVYAKFCEQTGMVG